MRAFRNACASLALSLALGGLVVGFAVALPGLGSNQLLDANLKRALANPMELNIMSFVCMTTAVAAVVMLGRSEGKVPTTCVLLALIGSLALRLWVLPESHTSVSLVDLEAQLPAHRFQEALAWRQRTGIFQAVIGLLLAATIVARDTLALRSLRAFAHPHQRAGSSSAPDEPSA